MQKLSAGLDASPHVVIVMSPYPEDYEDGKVIVEQGELQDVDLDVRGPFANSTDAQAWATKRAEQDDIEMATSKRHPDSRSHYKIIRLSRP